MLADPWALKINSRALFWHNLGKQNLECLTELLKEDRHEQLNCQKCCPKLRQNLFFFSVIAPNLHCKIFENLWVYYGLQTYKFVNYWFLIWSHSYSRGKYPSNLAEITWSQISTPKKQIHIRSSRAPLKIYFANLEYIFHCCKYNMLQRNYRVHSERKINCMQEHDTGRSLLL